MPPEDIIKDEQEFKKVERLLERRKKDQMRSPEERTANAIEALRREADETDAGLFAEAMKHLGEPQLVIVAGSATDATKDETESKKD